MGNGAWGLLGLLGLFGLFGLRRPRGRRVTADPFARYPIVNLRPMPHPKPPSPAPQEVSEFSGPAEFFEPETPPLGLPLAREWPTAEMLPDEDPPDLPQPRRPRHAAGRQFASPAGYPGPVDRVRSWFARR